MTVVLALHLLHLILELHFSFHNTFKLEWCSGSPVSGHPKSGNQVSGNLSRSSSYWVSGNRVSGCQMISTQCFDIQTLNTPDIESSGYRNIPLELWYPDIRKPWYHCTSHSGCPFGWYVRHGCYVRQPLNDTFVLSNSHSGQIDRRYVSLTRKPAASR